MGLEADLFERIIWTRFLNMEADWRRIFVLIYHGQTSTFTILEDVSTDNDKDDEEPLVYTAHEILKIGLLLVGFRRR
jgi:hypothetical protein